MIGSAGGGRRRTPSLSLLLSRPLQPVALTFRPLFLACLFARDRLFEPEKCSVALFRGCVRAHYCCTHACAHADDPLAAATVESCARGRCDYANALALPSIGSLIATVTRFACELMDFPEKLWNHRNWFCRNYFEWSSIC